MLNEIVESIHDSSLPTPGASAPPPSPLPLARSSRLPVLFHASPPVHLCYPPAFWSISLAFLMFCVLPMNRVLVSVKSGREMGSTCVVVDGPLDPAAQGDDTHVRPCMSIYR